MYFSGYFRSIFGTQLLGVGWWWWWGGGGGGLTQQRRSYTTRALLSNQNLKRKSWWWCFVICKLPLQNSFHQKNNTFRILKINYFSASS